MIERKFRSLRLETERLTLRRFCDDDLRDVMDWDEGATGGPAPEARQFLDFCFRQYEQAGEGPWAILSKESGKIVGNCAFVWIRDFCGEVNYFVAPAYRGQGFATEAVRALCTFGFDDLGLLRIQARCAPDNVSSERVLQKIGMKFNGIVERTSAAETHPAEKMYAFLQQDFASGLASTPAPLGS
jgi:[ribosomal protein S5]-alanine N-acetyltransferase